MKIKEIKQNLLRNLGNIFLHGIINVLCKTVKVNRINYSVIEKLLSEKQKDHIYPIINTASN